jgi:hypothetical protein
MRQNETLEVGQVGNGFIVRVTPTRWFEANEGHATWLGTRDEYLVFRTMAELQLFLAEHFTHRAHRIAEDTATVAKNTAVPT